MYVRKDAQNACAENIAVSVKLVAETIALSAKTVAKNVAVKTAARRTVAKNVAATVARRTIMKHLQIIPQITQQTQTLKEFIRKTDKMTTKDFLI